MALGRIFARTIEGLDWWLVEDEYGRNICLRYRETTLRVNRITMISKRIERGEDVDVQHLYDRIRDWILDMKDRTD